jgi:DNA-binding LytR/AlgR family response regulator
MFLIVFDIFYVQTSKNSLSELEKRERRAMERKLSEMEEELKVCCHTSLLFNYCFFQHNGIFVRLLFL